MRDHPLPPPRTRSSVLVRRRTRASCNLIPKITERVRASHNWLACRPRWEHNQATLPEAKTLNTCARFSAAYLNGSVLLVADISNILARLQPDTLRATDHQKTSLACPMPSDRAPRAPSRAVTIRIHLYTLPRTSRWLLHCALVFLMAPARDLSKPSSAADRPLPMPSSCDSGLRRSGPRNGTSC